MAGFECTYALAEEGVRWDLLRDSMHDTYVREDYALLAPLGIRTVREGFSWHQIDKGNGVYDFSRYEPMLEAGRDLNIEQIWDCCHYDYPERLDPFTDEFISAFTSYALQCYKKICEYQKGTIYLVLFNEISYWAWMGANRGIWAPYTKGIYKSIVFKSQLIKATIAAMNAIRDIDTHVRFIQADPFMYREAMEPSGRTAQKAASEFNEIARFQTWDMLCGKSFPELGGSPDFLDIIGINYYIDNQQFLITPKKGSNIVFERIPYESNSRKTLASLLKDILERYNRPLVITETGSYGENRESWWKSVLPEIEACRAQKLPLFGVCNYPTIDNPIDGHFLVPHSGLWDFEPGDLLQKRHAHKLSFDELKPYMQKWNFT